MTKQQTEILILIRHQRAAPVELVRQRSDGVVVVYMNRANGQPGGYVRIRKDGTVEPLTDRPTGRAELIV